MGTVSFCLTNITLCHMNVSEDLVSPGPGDTNQHKTRWNNKHGRLQNPNRVNLSRGSNGRLLYQCSLNEFSNWAALLSVLWYHHSVVFIFAQPLSLFTALPKNSPNLPTANRCPQTSPPMLITCIHLLLFTFSFYCHLLIHLSLIIASILCCT